MRKVTKQRHEKELTGRQFDKLPNAEKERIYRALERKEIPTRSPTPTEQERLKRVQAKMGRPVVSSAVRTISLTVEKNLLEQADAYARTLGMTRAQLVAQGLKSVMGSAKHG